MKEVKFNDTIPITVNVPKSIYGMIKNVDTSCPVQTNTYYLIKRALFDIPDIKERCDKALSLWHKEMNKPMIVTSE